MTDGASAPHVLAGFHGTSLDPDAAEVLAAPTVAGVTLYRHHNVGDPAQVHGLTRGLAGLGGRALPLLVAADQETGQLVGLGPATTPFPGAMALGATDDPELAERVALAVGREVRALGADVVYAPVCDLATSPTNPALGTRAFGDGADRVASLVAATVRGLQAAGVAAVAKHLPGLGDVVTDTHHGPGAVPHARDRLEAVELAPFRAAVEAGVRLVMTGHIGVPAITGDPDLPATLSPHVVQGIVREHLGFEGLVVTDALDMAALGQGEAGLVDAVVALRAGVDLLLCPADLGFSRRVLGVVDAAVRRGLVPGHHTAATRQRLEALHRRLDAGPARPDLDVVGCTAHRDLAREVADRSVTLVRDRAGLGPPAAHERVLVVHPAPSDRTPADTSSEVHVDLAGALRHHLGQVEGIVTSPSPTRTEVDGAVAAVAGHDRVVVATMDAVRDPGQADLVAALQATGAPLVTAALRTPWDLTAYPDVDVHLCTYAIQPPAIAALAAVIAGAQPARGRLPVRLEGEP